MRERWVRFGLLAGTAAFYGVLFNRETGLSLSIGYNLQAAERILGGEVPYRDFHTLYPPASLYLNAAAFKTLGVGLLSALAVVLLFKLLTVFVLYLSGRLILPMSWSVAACAVALPWLRPNGPFKAVPMHYGALFLALALYFLLRARDDGNSSGWALVGLCLGVLTLFKHNIGCYAVAGTMIAVWLNPAGRRTTTGLWILTGFSLPLAATGLLFWLSGGLFPMLRALLFGPGEFLLSRLGSMPSPLTPLAVAAGPLIGGWLVSRSRVGRSAQVAIVGCAFLAPLTFVALADRARIDPLISWLPVLVVAALLAGWSFPEWRSWSRGPGLPLLVAAGAAYLEMFPRFAREQAVAAMPFVILLAFALLHRRREGLKVRFGAGSPVSWLPLLVPLLFLSVGMRLFAETFLEPGLDWRSDTPLTSTRGRGCYFPFSSATEIDRVVSYLDSHVPAGGYFFAHSRLGSSLLFLTGRKNPSPVQFWDGVGVTDGDRQKTLATLENTPVDWVVTGDGELGREAYGPMREYLQSRFDVNARFGELLILRRK